VNENIDYWLAFNLQKTNRLKYQSSQPYNSHYYVDQKYGPLPEGFFLEEARDDDGSYVMRAAVVISPPELPSVITNEASDITVTPSRSTDFSKKLCLPRQSISSGVPSPENIPKKLPIRR
jgi:hypothetical protein